MNLRVLAGADDRGPVVSAGIALSGIAVLVLTVPLGLPVFEVSVLVALMVVAAVAYRRILQWQIMLAITILAILFIPIKRYALPGNLPLDLEPYRLIVMLVVAGWATSLLVDPRVRLRASGFEGPMLLILFAAIASDAANPGRVSSLGVQGEVLKAIMFLASFLLVFYLVVSVIRTRELIDFLVRILVAGGSAVAVFAVIESRTGYNAFSHLDAALPFLKDTNALSGEALTRAGHLRVFGPAQSPIALGAAFDMLIPLAVYLTWRTKRWVWAVAVVLLMIGSLATLTRTSVVMLVPLVLAFLWLRPIQTRRLWPLLVPTVCAIYIAVPGTLGTLKASFFPEGGLIAQQDRNAGTTGSGRIADIEPALAEWETRPILGQGYATRQTGRENRQTLILDNQWLKTLVETGVVGAFAWFWLYARFIRRLGAEARRDQSPDGVLAVALASSVAAFAVGMFFYDAFSFIQATFLLYFLLGLGASLLRASAAERAHVPERRARPAAVQTSTPG
jgi:polysaccharide biosynthesis protein PslJ